MSTLLPARRMRLDRAAVVASWRALRLGDRPALLDLPDHGATLAARDAADRAALADLRDRGLARDDGRPAADLADALTALARPEVDVDLRCWDPDLRGWFAAVSGELAVVVEPDEHGWTLDVAGRPTGTGLVETVATKLLDRLPDEPPLPGVPFTAPAAALFGDAPRHALAPAVGQRLAALRAGPPRRRMQLGAGIREGGSRRRVGPVTVVDAGPGRAMIEVDGATVRVRPGTTTAIAAELARRPGP